MKAYTLLTLLILFISDSSLAQSGTKNGTFDLSGADQLQILIDAGMEIKIEGKDTQSISYTYTFDGNQESYEHYFTNFSPDFEKSGGRAALRIEFPRQKKQSLNFRIKKHELILEIPRELELEFQSRYSKVEVSNIARTTTLTNRSGKIFAHNMGQELRVLNEYGNVRAENINGNVTINSRSSNIDVKQVRGDLNIDSDYSKLNISQVSGESFIKSKSGTVNAFDLKANFTAVGDYTKFEVTNISGDVDIDTKSTKIYIDNVENLVVNGDYTNIHAQNITGEHGVQIDSKSAKINLEKVRGTANVKGEYLNISLSDINKDAFIINKSGSVDTKNVQGDIQIDGSYNKINLDTFKGSNLRINNRSGSIEVEAMNKLNSIEIESEYGNVTLDLNTPFKGNLDLEIRYGSLDHPFTVNGSIVKESNLVTVEGTAGNETGVLRVKLRNGDLKIK